MDPFINFSRELRTAGRDFSRLEVFLSEALKREIDDCRILLLNHEFQKIKEMRSKIVSRIDSESTAEFSSQWWLKRQFKTVKNRRKNAKELKELKMRVDEMIGSIAKFGLNNLQF